MTTLFAERRAELAASRSADTRARIDDVAELVRGGEVSRERLARRCGWPSVGALERALHRAGRRDLLASTIRG